MIHLGLYLLMCFSGRWWVCVCCCMCVCLADNEEALCLLIMTSWLWQKLEKMPEVLGWSSSVVHVCARVCVCVCVCVTFPGLTESSWALVNESQSIKDKNKTWPPAIWSRGQAIWLLPAHCSLCVNDVRWAEGAHV